MLVKAAPGTKCPREGSPKKYITDSPENVPETTYYLRRIRDGSLARADAAPQAAQKPDAPASKRAAPKPEAAQPSAAAPAPKLATAAKGGE
jgi:hypothetical protein